MIEQETLKKCLLNLQQKLRNVNKAGIYKNVDIECLPFLQLFDLNNNSAYLFSEVETELIRMYIGIWDEGNIPLSSSISERTEVNYLHVNGYIKRIFSKFYSSEMQKMIIDERNMFIKNNLENGDIKEKILNTDISFIPMPDRYLYLFRKIGINLIGDLIRIDYPDILKMNSKCNYDYVTIFPRYIVEMIHDLGLEFENEEIFYDMHFSDDDITDIVGTDFYKNRTGDLSAWMRYKSDFISFCQYIPQAILDYELEYNVGNENKKLLMIELSEFLVKSKKEEILMSMDIGVSSESVSSSLNDILCDVFSLKRKYNSRVKKKK